MEVINLNIIPGKAQPIVHTSQYDVGRVIRCNLFEGAEVFYLDGTETISCNIKKPDNNIVTLSVTNTNDSYVEITTTEQATACDGSNLCEISITKGDDVIGSLNFIMEVERSPIEGGISSASEINNLWTQVDGMVADALATQYDSANVVFDNLPTEGHGIPYTVTSEGIGNAIDNALDMTDTASGAIATFDTSLALPLQDCKIAINAVQESGTPTPQDSKAISGFTGANIKQFGANLISGDTYQLGANVVLLGESAGDTYSTYLKATKYTISFTRPTSKTFRLDLTDSNGVQTRLINAGTATSKTFTIETEGFYKFGTYMSGGMTPSDIANVMLVEGPEVKPYTAYTAPTTTAITWQSEAGTVYGGSLDVTTGVLMVTHKFITFDFSSTADIGGGYRRKSYVLGADKAVYPPTASNPQICNVATYKASYAEQSTHFYCGTDNCNIILPSDTPTSTTIEVVYELVTPTTYQLTPTQISAIVGTNNVFTDTNGDTSLEYYTKRGEQTVRIAEGVAVDVINNKSIDTLATTDKTVKGAINELEAGKVDISTIFNDCFKVTSFTSNSITVSAGAALNVTATDMNYAIPTGYVPAAVFGWYCGSNDIFARSIELTATGASSFCVLRNVGSSAYTGTFQASVLFIKA